MKTKLSPFGKLIRVLRLENEIRTKDMAASLAVSVAYLSAIETGKKKLNDDFVENVVNYFTNNYSNIDTSLIYNAADRSKEEFTINVENSNYESRELVAQFARKFPSLTDDKEKSKQLLEFLDRID